MYLSNVCEIPISRGNRNIINKFNKEILLMKCICFGTQEMSLYVAILPGIQMHCGYVRFTKQIIPQKPGYSCGSY